MNILEQYLRYKQINSERDEIFEILDSINFEKLDENKKPHSLDNILLLLPSIYPNLGGVTSALRIADFLAKNKIRVTIGLCSDMKIDIASNNVTLCMPSLKAEVKYVKDCKDEQYDVIIATSWNTAYYANNLNGYKVYFVQDYEPYFRPVDDFSLIAKKTYTLGYHIISLGRWNLNQINKNINSKQCKMDSIDFPYNQNEYCFDGRDYQKYKYKKSINIACYIRFIGRRLPYISEYLLGKLKEELKSYDINCNILYFGIDKRNKFTNGKNLGKLNRKELFELYQKCDFGMVASMSNISLVPYEMLATGLPLIEYKDGSFSDFMGTDTAILTDLNYKKLTNDIVECIKNPDKLEVMHKNVTQELGSLSWEKTCEQFYNILLGIVERN